jgi:branched-chain amino acid transport system ATP-binding protein
MSALLTVAGLTLGYGRNPVIHGVDLAVPTGSIVSLIGANGAGKTTMLRGLSGLLRARGGSVRFDGAEIAGQPAYRIARLGVVQVPEGRQVFANMTIADNLRLGAFLVRDAAEIARRRDAVLARFPRLGERLAQQAGLLSGGEQQMLAIGRALMADPKLLLLEQNAQAALEVADYAYVLETGRIKLHGPGQVIANDPQVIAAYLGAA